MKAYQEKIKDKEKDIIKIGYYAAYFSNSKKIKSLKHYMKEIDNLSSSPKFRNNAKLQFAKEMCEKVSKTDIGEL